MLLLFPNCFLICTNCIKKASVRMPFSLCVNFGRMSIAFKTTLCSLCSYCKLIPLRIFPALSCLGAFFDSSLPHACSLAAALICVKNEGCQALFPLSGNLPKKHTGYSITPLSFFAAFAREFLYLVSCRVFSIRGYHILFYTEGKL